MQDKLLIPQQTKFLWAETQRGKHTKDLTGLKFNRLTAMNFVGYDYKRNARWLFKCDCGNITEANGSAVSTGKTKSCGCLAREKWSANGKKVVYVNFGPAIKSRTLTSKQKLINRLYSTYKYSAKKKKHTFEISKEIFTQLIFSNCFYCGNTPSLIYKDPRKTDNQELQYNGLDRVDSKIGYTVENTKSCCWKCNCAKASLTMNEFINHISQIYQHLMGGKNDKRTYQKRR